MKRTGSKTEKSQIRIRTAARKLLRGLEFLHKAMLKIGELGVVGENRNKLILFLAALTKNLDVPVSVLVKGQSSSGKSNLIRTVLQLFPPECVISRASLSAKAPVHGEESVKGRILYLFEYRGGKDAQYLLRLQQSEKYIAHEYATITGGERKTNVSEREGSPVVLTTTTESKVFADDETRFLSVWIDDSPQQTLAVMEAQVHSDIGEGKSDLAVWQEAIRLVGRYRNRVLFPGWFVKIAALVPRDHVRVRRDWERFLAFCKVVAICRSAASGAQQQTEVEVNFSDYCVAYTVLNSALASSVHQSNERALDLANAVRRLFRKLKRPVTVKEVAAHLQWKGALAYKYLNVAIKRRFVKQVSGTRQSNQKLLEPVPSVETGFLPSPKLVFATVDEINVEDGAFLDPLTGKRKVFVR